MSQMKREGFRFHDLTATMGGGFYPERPLLSWGRLQGHRDGAMWECCARGGGDGESKSQCREFSGVAEFSTASLPPRFAAFVACGTPQVGWFVVCFAVETKRGLIYFPGAVESLLIEP